MTELPTPANTERRKHARVEVAHTALRVSAGGLLGRWRAPGPPRVLTDLSLGGCRFLTDQLPGIGERLQLQLEVPAFAQPIRLRAIVIWHDDEGEVGVRFTAISEEARRALDRLIDDGKLRTIERLTQSEDDALAS